jgi:biotin carboxyl carrier protein
VTVNGQFYDVEFQGNRAIVNGNSYLVDVNELGGARPTAPSGSSPLTMAEVSAPAETARPTSSSVQTSTPGGEVPLVTQLPGLVLRIEKPVGSAVRSGDTVLVVESMKMENAIVAPVDGTVKSVLVSQGGRVESGQTLATVG